jgi:hypothetical protein
VENPTRYRCEMTREFVAQIAPQLDEILWWHNERLYESLRARRRIPVRLLRWLSLVVAFLGVVVAGVGIVVTPDCPAARGHPTTIYYACILVFVIVGTLFAFQPSVALGVRQWTRRRLARLAQRLANAVRKQAPYVAE